MGFQKARIRRSGCQIAPPTCTAVDQTRKKGFQGPRNSLKRVTKQNTFGPRKPDWEADWSELVSWWG